jgi:hypothetical protein
VGGFFKVYRDIFQHEIFKHELDFRLFMLILGNATYEKEGKVIEGIHVKRGQWIRSYRMLMKDLEYRKARGYSQYGIATIKRAISRLIKNDLVTISETECGTLFTVVNYEKYQGFSTIDEDNAEHYPERKWNESGTKAEQNKEIKKDKKLIDDNNAPEPLPDPFEEQLTDEQRLEKEIADYYETKKGRFAKPTDWDFIRKAIEEKFTRDEMIQGINLAFLQAKSINSFEYCLKVMRTEREKRLRQQKKKVVPMQRQQRPGRKEKLPEALRPESQQIAPQLTPEELAEKQRQIQEKLKRMNERIAQKGVY